MGSRDPEYFCYPDRGGILPGMSGENIRAACVGLGRWAGVLAEGVQKRPGLRSPPVIQGRASEKRRSRGNTDAGPIPTMRPYLKTRRSTPSSSPRPTARTWIRFALRPGRASTCSSKSRWLSRPLTPAHACERARSAGVVLMVGHCWRWVASVQKAKALVDAGELGQVTQAAGHFGNARAQNYGREIWRDDPGESPLGPFTGPGFHLLDILEVPPGARGRSVRGTLERKMSSGSIPDTASGALRFASGPIAQVSSSFVTQRCYQLSLFGTRANLYVNADPEGGTQASPDLVIHRQDDAAPEIVRRRANRHDRPPHGLFCRRACAMARALSPTGEREPPSSRCSQRYSTHPEAGGMGARGIALTGLGRRGARRPPPGITCPRRRPMRRGRSTPRR